MKTVVTVALIWLIGAPTVAFANDFCDGYKSGYETGYKRAAQTSIPPIPPICPIQPIKSLSDPQNDFEHGYVLGLQDGHEEGYSRSPYR